MRYIAIIIVALSVFFVTSTLVFANEAVEITPLQKIIYQDFHDPGFAIFEAAAGNIYEGDFYYSFITYEEINTWTSGEAMQVAYHPVMGLGVLREKDNRFYKLSFKSTYFVDAIEDECLKSPENETTIGISSCILKSANIWGTEYNYLYQHLMKNVSVDLKSELLELNASWENLGKRFQSARRQYYSEKGGTIYSIYGAHRLRDMSMYKANMLRSFYE